MEILTLSLGSNVDAAGHIDGALTALDRHFGELRLSSVFESKAVGFSGRNFLNMVVAVQTDAQLADISAFLKALETEHGRVDDQQRFSSRTLDIDILTYGARVGRFEGMELPRPEITENAYVLWPLAEVCGELLDPHSGRSYAELWRAYDKARQDLWKVDFEWQGRRISSAQSSDLAD
jgi:2-amino-4-hydroxy-6-hydroxymethyldihydropteridine diphosphokinase